MFQVEVFWVVTPSSVVVDPDLLPLCYHGTKSKFHEEQREKWHKIYGTKYRFRLIFISL